MLKREFPQCKDLIAACGAVGDFCLECGDGGLGVGRKTLGQAPLGQHDTAPFAPIAGGQNVGPLLLVGDLRTDTLDADWGGAASDYQTAQQDGGEPARPWPGRSLAERGY